MRKNYMDEDYYEELPDEPSLSVEEQFGCGFCWDKKKKKSK